jgi:uncharacterized GH25 family protein
LLCGLHGLARDEAARQLGWPSGSVKGRLERGRELLRKRLTKRGLTVPAVLAAGLAVDSARAVPPALVRATARAALAVPPAAPPLKALAAAVVLAVLGVSMGVGTTTLPGRQSDTPAAPPPPPAPPAAARTLRVVVLDPQGQPLAVANVKAGIWTEEKDFKATREYKTDAAGAAQVELPKTFYILRLWASKKPFVTMFASWEQNELANGTAVPAEYVFRLESAGAAGGRVVDEQGKPIPGAKVQVMLPGQPKTANGDGRVRYSTWLAERNDAATTDAEGRWRIDNVPNHPQVELSLLITHPDYVSDEHWRQVDKVGSATTAALRQQTATVTLTRGVIVTGRVTDPAGQPIKDAIVIHGDDSYFSSTPCKFPTDADGRFRLPALAPGQTTLTVVAAGWAPQLRRVNLQAELPPQDFRLGPGKPIRLKIVDPIGKPLPNAAVGIIGWKGSKSLQSMHNPNHPKVPDTKIPRRTDAGGVWEWPSAPDDPVKLQIGLKGFATS